MGGIVIPSGEPGGRRAPGSPGSRLRRGGSRGFTLVELMVSMVVGMIVVIAVYSMFIEQTGLYSFHRAQADTRETLRSAALLLGWELMETSAAGGDVHAIGSSSVTLRKIVAAGITCAREPDGSNYRFGLRHLSGTFASVTEDSALYYMPETEKWGAASVTDVWIGSSALDSPKCVWGDTANAPMEPDAAVKLEWSAELADVTVGAPIRLFEIVEYGLFEEDGRWWLGRRDASGGEWAVLTGPLLSEADGGLALTYLDASGSVTTDPASVATVEIALRGESRGRTSGAPSGGDATIRDSVRFTAHLRNGS